MPNIKSDYPAMKTLKLTFYTLLQIVFFINYSFAQIDNNDYFSKAEKIDVGKKYSFQLGEKTIDGFRDRRDVYKFDLPGDAAIIVKQTVRNDLLSGVGLYDSDTTWVYGQHCCVQNGTDSVVGHTHLKQGTYYVLIQGDPPAVTTYDLFIEYAPPPYANDTEPNSTCDKATKLELSKEAFGHLGYTKKDDKDRKDWYYVDLSDDGYLQIIEKTAGGNLHPLIGLWENNGVKLINAVLSDSLYHARLKAGRYFIELGDAEGPGSYKLTANFFPAGLTNDLEPNDNPVSASKIQFESTYNGHLNYYRNDSIDREDWYYVETPEDGELIIVMNPNPDKNPRCNILSGIHLFESEGSRLVVYVYGKTTSDTLIYSNLQKGKYHIKLVGWGDTYGPYSLKVYYHPVNLLNDKEKNDELTGAIPLVFDKEYTGHLGYYSNGNIDERDYYTFSLQRSTKVQVVETAFVKLFTNFWILDSLNRIIPDFGISKSNLNGKDTLTANLSAGKYYVRVFKDQFGYGTYKLTATSVQTTDNKQLIEIESVKIFPNPVNEYLSVSIKTPMKDGTLEIMDAHGKRLFTTRIGQGETTFAIQDIPVGLYFITIRYANSMFTRKMLKM
jgi:hypothetical protein